MDSQAGCALFSDGRQPSSVLLSQPFSVSKSFSNVYLLVLQGTLNYQSVAESEYAPGVLRFYLVSSWQQSEPWRGLLTRYMSQPRKVGKRCSALGPSRAHSHTCVSAQNRSPWCHVIISDQSPYHTVISCKCEF